MSVVGDKQEWDQKGNGGTCREVGGAKVYDGYRDAKPAEKTMSNEKMSYITLSFQMI